MQQWKLAGLLLVAAASVVGCDKNDNNAPVPVTTPKAPTAVDTAKENMSNAVDATKDKAADMKDAARTASFADPAEGVYLKRVTEETYSRDPLETDRLSRKGDAWADLRAK